MGAVGGSHRAPAAVGGGLRRMAAAALRRDSRAVGDSRWSGCMRWVRVWRAWGRASAAMSSSRMAARAWMALMRSRAQWVWVQARSSGRVSWAWSASSRVEREPVRKREFCSSVKVGGDGSWVAGDVVGVASWPCRALAMAPASEGSSSSASRLVMRFMDVPRVHGAAAGGGMQGERGGGARECARGRGEPGEVPEDGHFSGVRGWMGASKDPLRPRRLGHLPRRTGGGRTGSEQRTSCGGSGGLQVTRTGARGRAPVRRPRVSQR